MMIRCDSQSVICLTKNQMLNARTKHIDIRYHPIRDWLDLGEITVEKVHTDENASDCLTKPVLVEKFRHCLNLLNLSTC